ncbi:MAG: hypothetical protein JO038_09430 [Alphaproteobacteria bacterium]|nr:hypothetical protein [Alphaproteobacteria bacterium]
MSNEADTRVRPASVPDLRRPDDRGDLALEPAASRHLSSIFHRPLVITAGPVRRLRRLPFRLISFLCCVVLPAIAAGYYYFFWASDQYIAEARFGVRAAETSRPEIGSLGALSMGMGPTRVDSDSYVIVQYVASRAMVDNLRAKFDFAAMFARPSADWPARLSLPATAEELDDYWKDHIDAFYDQTSGIIDVKVRAFTPQDALKLADAVTAASEQLVNQLSARARADIVRNSEEEVKKTETRLTAILAKIRQFRDAQGVIDPRKSAETSSTLAARLRDELVKAKSEMGTLRAYLSADAPSVKVLEARIRAMDTQLRALQGEVTGTATAQAQPGQADTPPLSGKIGTYEELESDRIFAERAYQRSLETLDRARENADRQQEYLATFVSPTLPEEALYPRRFRSVGVAIMLCFAIWAIGLLTVQSVREHL